jgi:hypothetical protein
LTDEQTILRLLPRSEAHVQSAKPRRREYVLMAIFVLLLIASL